MVRHKGTKQEYALKYVDKEKCIKIQAQDSMIRERYLLEEINNGFIW